MEAEAKKIVVVSESLDVSLLDIQRISEQEDKGHDAA